MYIKGRLHFFLFSIAICLWGQTTVAQIPLNNVVASFDALPSRPEIFHVSCSSHDVPSGGHLQGIQALSDSIIIITASSGSFSYYINILRSKKAGKQLSVNKIADSPMRHAGGCQMIGHILYVGVENNITKDTSDIHILKVNDSGALMLNARIGTRGGHGKASTAGAMGAVATADGKVITAVGGWDSRDIDIYMATGEPASYHITVDGRCAYQSVNLITDSAGRLYLIGFGRSGMKNRADLFEITIHTDSATAKLIGTRDFQCRGGAGFRYGAGIRTTADGRLQIYSCGRNPGRNTPVNIYR